MKRRLAILSTHPIQYNAPLFRLLAAEEAMELKVFYSKVAEEVRFDKDFGQEVVWDIPLTEGYAHSFFRASHAAGRNCLLEAIAAFAPDALLVYGWNFPGHFKAMRHFHGKIPVWFRGDSTLLDPLPLWRKGLRKIWLRWVYSHVDIAFYVGSANKKYFQWAGLSDEQLEYAPHAVDNEFFMRDDSRRTNHARLIRRDLRIPEEAQVFLYSGKLEPKKQPLQLAEVFSKTFSENSSVHLVYVGSGPMREALEQLARSTNNIHVLGFVNQGMMPSYYRLADVVCLPSFGPGETWGLAINEAIASHNCAVFTTDRVGCSNELLRDPYTCVVSAINVSDWPEALKKLSRHAILPENRRNTFVSHYHFEQTVRALRAHLIAL
jgi:glycosyltransferase involved in cell wall biosynthesis